MFHLFKIIVSVELIVGPLPDIGIVLIYMCIHIYVMRCCMIHIGKATYIYTHTQTRENNNNNKVV